MIGSLQKSRVIKICITVFAVLSVVAVSFFGVSWISEPANQLVFRKWIEKTGPIGWVVVALMQFMHIVIAPVPAEPIQILSGTLYGAWGGIVLNILGSIPASMLVFWIGKRYGKPFLYKLFGKEKIERIHVLHQPDKLEIATVIIMLIPAAPKDIISYVCGVSSMKMSRFVVIATLARIPTNLMCTMVGASLQEGKWKLATAISVIMVVIVFIGIKMKDKILSGQKSKQYGDAKTQKKVLLSEGSSLTSRETLTSLCNSGYIIDIITSAKRPMTLFSKWKNKLIFTYNVNENPHEYLTHVSKLINSGAYEALIPTHETAWLFSEGRRYFSSENVLPVAAPASFHMVQSKISFAELADSLCIPHPRWNIVQENMAVTISCPYWIKDEYGTAGCSVYKISDDRDKKKIADMLLAGKNRLMAQEHIEGRYGQVQAVFNKGKMLAVHTSMQRGSGAGGSAAARISVQYPEAQKHMEVLGTDLAWHGSITLDFIEKNDVPYFIECNPRMIEPANATQAGINFPELLIKISSGGELPQTILTCRSGVKTHSLMALLLGSAEKRNSRKHLMKLLFLSIMRKDLFAESTEVLTPVCKDPRSIIPLLAVFVRLLIHPRNVYSIKQNTIDNYCVFPETINAIRRINT
ncbi:VTT domain-containing protein [Marispirochaeta aestuarii]|uniref:VTT domain-containing protein n=1 Tax=Marispirochaeta aestuarii TaxID=1963862 RepID=UPI0029C60693|nr:VTT domain-containing protein [Marispirochaeta aestuarii]